MSHGRRGAIDRLAEGYLSRRGRHGDAVGAGFRAAPSSRPPEGRSRLLRRLLLGFLLLAVVVTLVVGIALVSLVAWLLGNTDSALTWAFNLLDQIAQLMGALQTIGGEGGG